MSDRAINIAIGVGCIFVASVYMFGMWAWNKNEAYNKEQGRQIYTLSLFSVVYIMSFLLFLLSKSKPRWVKPVAATTNSIFAMVLYNHIWQQYRAWDKWSYIVIINFVLLYCIVDKIKKKINYD